MPIGVGSQLDFQKIPSLRFVVESAATGSPPGTPVDGQFWLDTTIHRLYVRENGAWVLASNTGTVGTADTAGGDLTGTFSNLQIAANAVGTAEIANSTVTYAKIQNVSATNKLLGRATAGAGVVEEIGLAADVAFSAGNLQVGAFTGDITKSAGSLATAIASSAVTYAKIQNVAASRILGNPTGSAAAPSEISLSADLAFSGTSLQVGAYTGDISKSAGSLATAIVAGSVTYAKIQNVSATNRLLGRATAGAGSVEEITLAADHSFAAGALQLGAFTGDITKTAGTLATTIANSAVTVAKLASSVNLNAIATAYANTADVPMNNFKITGLATPTNPTDAATKGYVDSVSVGLDVKLSVRAASTANIASVTYNATGGTSTRGQMTTAPNTLDSVSLAANDRILLKNQTTAAQNGIWVVSTLGTGANGVWDRAGDFDADAEVTAGAFTFVEDGGTQADTGWVLTTNNPIVIGGASGTALAWAQFSSSASLTAGNGINIASNVVSVVGTVNRISVSGAGVDIAATYVGQTSITTLGTVTTGTWTGTSIAVANGGTGATTAAAARSNLGAVGKFPLTFGAISAGVELNINHNLNSTEVQAMFRDATSNFEILFAWRVIDANNIGVTADLAYGASAVKVVVMG